VADWQYGDAGDRYPMKRGEVWRVGDHLFCVGDLEEGDHTRLMAFARSVFPSMPFCGYTDPPWDGGVAKSFRTKALGHSESRKVDFDGSFVPRLLDACGLVGGPCGMEIGAACVDKIQQKVQGRGWNSIRTHITYFRRYPGFLYSFNSSGGDPLDISDLAGFDDAKVVEPFLVKCRESGSRVATDFCTGRGLTAKAAFKAGLSFVGMELNQRRLAVAMALIVKLTGKNPSLINTL